MNILSIETSCDETAAAIVKDGRFVISNVIASQAKLHAQYGGVVPEVAARKHVELIVPVIHEVLKAATCTKNDINAIAVTKGPGLITSLLVGIDAAKSLAFAWNKKVIPVHHIQGHIYANQIRTLEGKKIAESSDFVFPSICLTVSGGHTDLVLLESHQRIRKLGSTVDDAAGEAFDKVAALLGFGYPGGPIVSQCARKGDASRFPLPSPMIDQDNYNFSFSGLKTAVREIVNKKRGKLNKKGVQDICASFEKAVVKVLVYKTARAAREYKVKKIMLSGGVAANEPLRKECKTKARTMGIAFFCPPPVLCTDNAAMIGAAAYFQRKNAVDFSKVRPDLRIDFKVAEK